MYNDREIVISINFYYLLIGEKKGRGENVVTPGSAVIELAIIYMD